jgi:hypothetical protein
MDTQIFTESSLRVDQEGKVYIHLGEEELSTIAKAVAAELLKQERERNSL